MLATMAGLRKTWALSFQEERRHMQKTQQCDTSLNCDSQGWESLSYSSAVLMTNRAQKPLGTFGPQCLQ